MLSLINGAILQARIILNAPVLSQYRKEANSQKRIDSSSINAADIGTEKRSRTRSNGNYHGQYILDKGKTRKEYMEKEIWR